MTKDPIVDEVRKYREEHVAAYGHDIKRIAAALREREVKSQRPLLNPGPKYLLKKTGG
ncbi:hypothetical protein [Thiocystis violascens]|uniref:hypothetical protein n=1 Tax=Thiocystis violascens TaxID=73141 RepID=UPI00145F3E4D|nr:hypothetical protein [Thiocystis violascens]